MCVRVCVRAIRTVHADWCTCVRAFVRVVRARVRCVKIENAANCLPSAVCCSSDV